MKCLIASLVVLVSVAAPAGAQWLDEFDSYTPGPLSPQSNWEPWDLKASNDCEVSTAFSFTGSNSVLVNKADSVVYDFANLPSGRPTSGLWLFSIKTYVPSTASGNGQVSMLNTFTHNGAQTYSLRVWFDSINGDVFADGPGGLSTPMFKDEWITLLVCVDLDTDSTTVYYGTSAILAGRSWKNGLSGGGASEIAVVELFGAASIDEFYLDNARMEQGGGKCLCFISSPNPISTGQNLKLVSQGRGIPNGSLGAVMSWTVNGNLFISGLLFPFYGFGNRFVVNATVPPGLSGLKVGLKSLAAPGSGGLQLSNEDVIVFQ